MRKALLAATVAFAATSAWAVPGCGDEAVLATVKKLVRDAHFAGNEDRLLELANVRATDFKEAIGTYTCVAALRFEVTDGDIIYRKGPFPGLGEVQANLRYQVAEDATDPSKYIVSIWRIRALEIGLDL